MRTYSDYKPQTPEEEDAYQYGFIDGVARSLEMQARIRLKRVQEEDPHFAGILQEFLSEIGYDQINLVLEFIEEIAICLPKE
jgi:hypothetical protein